MANYDLDISCSNPVPKPIKVTKDDTVTFINNTGASVELKFSDSDAFKPKKSKIDIPSPGDHTLTIGGGEKLRPINGSARTTRNSQRALAESTHPSFALNHQTHGVLAPNQAQAPFDKR